MSQIKRSRTRRSDDTMDEDSDEKNSKRKSRNLSEKKRRDQFNLLVNELSSMVSTGGRKMDKSTVLKSTIAFLKNHNEIAVRSKVHEIQEDWKPSFLTNEEFTHLVLEAVDGFVMVFSNAGQIFYASESITSLLGHLPNEVLSMTIYEMACEEEQNTLYNTLLSMVEEESQVSFACHMRRGGIAGSKESGYFELVHFFGYFRSNADVIEGDNRYSGYSGEADTRLVFVGTGRLHTPQLIKEMSLIDSSKSEFTSRHSLEWKFLFLDHRAPPIIGYLPFELLGTSGYDYYHIDDLEKVTSCHEALMQKGEGTSCYYRFLTKGQQWIWLQTRFYITYHQWNSKPEFVVCTHRVVSYTDVKKQKTQRGETCPDRMSPTSSNSTTTVTWQNVANKGKFGQRAGSDCTSMSADSPASKHSATTLHSTRSRASQGKLTSNQPPQQQHQHQSFLEPPPQYMAAIPLQPVITGFSSPAAVLSPLPAAEMTPQQSQIHDDLQRKHAKLQAAIDQQQAELRVVSEQLLMAKLGMLQQHHPQPPVSSPYVYSCGNVSSTSAVPGGVMPVSPAISVIGQPADSGILQIQPLVNAPSTLNVHAKSHPSNAPHYPMPDSNTPPK